jgi:hypothetical protein
LIFAGLASRGDWVKADGHADSVGLLDDTVRGAFGVSAVIKVRTEVDDGLFVACDI